MTISISITDDALLATVRAYLLTVLGSGWGVFVTQDNRVPMPNGDFVTMTRMGSLLLSTPTGKWVDPGTNPGSSGLKTSVRGRFQLDFYGAGAADAIQIVHSLFRTSYTCEQMATSGLEVQPLYAEDPKNTTMINAEQQFQERWTLDAFIQFNPVVTVPLDFASSLEATVVEIDTTFPSGA